jgi:hypothetical protein
MACGFRGTAAVLSRKAALIVRAAPPLLLGGHTEAPKRLIGLARD